MLICDRFGVKILRLEVEDTGIMTCSIFTFLPGLVIGYCLYTSQHISKRQPRSLPEILLLLSLYDMSALNWLSNPTNPCYENFAFDIQSHRPKNRRTPLPESSPYATIPVYTRKSPHSNGY